MDEQNREPEQQEEPPTQEQVDEGMAEGGRLANIDRRLLHVDRVTESTAVRLQLVDAQVLTLIVMVATVGVMVYMLSRQIKGLNVEGL